MKNQTTILPLPVWQDPQGDIVLRMSETNCNVYFGCWESPGVGANYLANILFNGCTSSRYIKHEFIPYTVNNLTNEHSYILEINNSDWLNQEIAYRGNIYGDKLTINQRHFLIKSNDMYIELLATDYALQTINEENAGDLVYLIHNA